MYQTLGEFLKKLRTEQHITQAYTARQLGTSRQAYAYYENSAAIPDLDILIKLSELFQVPLQSFLDYCPYEHSDKLADSAPYSYQSYEQTMYPEFLTFYSEQENMKKYHYLNRSEKKILFMFQKLSETEQEELLQWAYFKYTIHQEKNPIASKKK